MKILSVANTRDTARSVHDELALGLLQYVALDSVKKKERIMAAKKATKATKHLKSSKKLQLTKPLILKFPNGPC